MDTHIWVRHRDHGGFWQCPVEALDDYAALGWEPSEAPPEPNPAIAERIAAQQAARARPAENETKPKAASRGETRE